MSNTKQKITKCNFCQWFQGNTCVRANSMGQVSYSYCYDANQEFKLWLEEQKKKKKTY